MLQIIRKQRPVLPGEQTPPPPVVWYNPAQQLHKLPQN
jgi:hypothetical protein